MARLSGSLVAASIVGVAIGLASYTLVYARGYSYLSDDPAACANCHVMRDHFDAWAASSHHAVATCNDCHTPPGLVPKYVTKARNGFWHSFYFTFGGYPDPLRITPRNHVVTEQACRTCHAAMTAAIDPPRAIASHSSGLSCTKCHDTVGHLQ